MEADDALSLQAGEVLAGKYRVVKILGRGGMGIVASAIHTELGTRVAIKILLPRAGDDRMSVERFAREARSASQLRSEHVVRVFDVGKLEDNRPYLVMEHLDGEDFDDLIHRDGPLPPATAVDYILQACEGLAEAHAAGIVHRDVKPGNLFLTRGVDGRPLVKVVDFGLAKEQSRKSLVSLTAPLIAVGSPQYMSPEQTRALDLDETSDIWSLGICLYEFMVGDGPFEAATVMDICARVLTDTPQAPHLLNAEIPRGLSDIVLRCLQKDRSKRYPNVGALAEALEEFGPASRWGAADRIRQVLAAPRVQSAKPEEAVAPAPPSSKGNARPRRVIPPAEPRAMLSRSGPQRRRRKAMLAAVAIGAVAAFIILLNVRAAKRVEAMATPPATATSTPTATSSDELPSIGLQAPRPGVVPTSPPQARNAAPTSRSGKRRPPGASGIDRVFPPDPPEPPPPVVPATAAAPVPVAPPATSAAAAQAPPRFVLASAHVDVGSATNTVGTTASNVNKAIGPLAGAMTNCYRGALAQSSGTVDGIGMLHIETDEEGVVTSARATGPVSAAARCIGGTAGGRKIPNVDTGRASADIPLSYKSQ